MKNNWEEITTQILSEHVGVLAGIIVDEARAKCHCSPVTETQSFLTEFVLYITNELPESVDRPTFLVHLRSALR